MAVGVSLLSLKGCGSGSDQPQSTCSITSGGISMAYEKFCPKFGNKTVLLKTPKSVAFSIVTRDHAYAEMSLNLSATETYKTNSKAAFSALDSGNFSTVHLDPAEGSSATKSICVRTTLGAASSVGGAYTHQIDDTDETSILIMDDLSCPYCENEEKKVNVWFKHLGIRGNDGDH
eukprot:Skav207164  [mRNA]  locus=scaffold573:456417:463891:- [translate_table: standard]